ncbi:MAG: PKD domain-containing protein [Sphingobacteriales bacterium]|nr:MAG: PKD domain-containing protein [Sphingobacteriales bacterium]
MASFSFSTRFHFTLLVMAFLVITSSSLFAQKVIRPTYSSSEVLPQWVQLLYSDNPNAWQVDSAFTAYYRTHPFVKTSHTQYYKKWRRANQRYINAQGFVVKPTPDEALAYQIARQNTIASQHAARSGGSLSEWTCVGPYETFEVSYNGVQRPKSEQANVYCFDQFTVNPNILYCGTEGGEIYKSINKGLNWTCMSRNYPMNAPTAIKIHPTNPDIVFAGAGNRIFRTQNGGVSWEEVYSASGLDVNDFSINPGNPLLILAASWNGLYRSTNGGNSWTPLYTQPCYDIEVKPDNPAIVYLLKGNPSQDRCEFFKSTDFGASFNIVTNGWYNSTDPDREDGGARMTVTPADPNRIYVALIGQAKNNDNGFIGIYRSNNAGDSWTLPNPPTGGPYTASHPNLASFQPDGSGFHQGFYNFGIAASHTNADQLLLGFLSLWKSTDGATTFLPLGGYVGSPNNYIHPDIQELEINGTDIWITSDGGINYSTDFVANHEARNNGINSSDFWGFSSGWNEDILVGGRYHNGNTAWYQNYPSGNFLGLGGGEAPTGYVNPGQNRNTYFSDIGGKRIPVSFDGVVSNIPFGIYPNESYWSAESGEVEFDPRCYNTVFVTNQNKIWKSEDGGTTFTLLYSFGTNTDAQALYLEISRSNPNIMYCTQRNADYWSDGYLWKSVNGGNTWTAVTLPPGYARRLLISLSATNANVLWLAFPDGANGQKIYRTDNGGGSWQNLTTTTLNDESIQALLHQGGTDGGVYLGTNRSVFYRNNNLPDWQFFVDGLPAEIASNILRPFYKDGKIRMGAYGKGIWECELYEPSVPVAQPMVNKRFTDCPGDTLQFEDYSVLHHAGANWYWEFPGGNPVTSTLRNPKVSYPIGGTYSVILTVTNPYGSDTKILTDLITVSSNTNNLPAETNFESGTGVIQVVNPDNSSGWQPHTGTNCAENGSTSYTVQCYEYPNPGQIDELVFPINMDLTEIESPAITFRVAYAPYIDGGGAWIDSLKVLVSNNCGNNFYTLFSDGGENLSTTTSGTGPNNKYEYDSFSPQNCNEWRNVCLDLRPYSGNYVTVKIQCLNGYGNNMYIDNLSFDNKPLVAPVIGGNNAGCNTQTAVYTAPGGGNTYQWTVTNGTILSGQGTATIEVEWAVGAGSVSVVIE